MVLLSIQHIRVRLLVQSIPGKVEHQDSNNKFETWSRVKKDESCFPFSQYNLAFSTKSSFSWYFLAFNIQGVPGGM